MAEALNVVYDALDHKRYHYLNEVQLHIGLEAAMREAGLDPKPEQKVKGGRIDFLVKTEHGTVGVEVKVKGSTDALRRQVTGYAADPGIDVLLVVTTRPEHRPVAGVVSGKVVGVLVIGRLST